MSRIPKFRSTWWEPIIIPRWMLVGKYVGFIVLGVIAGIYGIPTLSLTTFAGYTTVWAAVLVLGGALGLVASTRERWETAEKWGAVLVTSVMAGYAFAAAVLVFNAEDSRSATGRAAFLVVLIIGTMLPASRATSLLVRTGRKQ